MKSKTGNIEQESRENFSDIRFFPHQNYDCRSCGKCCRMWEIPVTLKEKMRIEKLKIPGFDFEKNSVFLPYKRLPGLFQISKKSNGDCVFLDDNNLCEIHKYFGESVKPLACRLHPFDVLNWENGAVSAAFKFDCPSVAFGKGKEINARLHEVKAFAKELGATSSGKATAIYNWRLDPGIDRLFTVSKAYEQILLSSKFGLPERFCAAARIMEFQSARKYASDITNAGEPFVREAAEFISNTASAFAEEIKKARPLNLNERLLFRYLLSGYLRVDEEVYLKKPIIGRLKRAKTILNFIFGRGSLKALNRDCPDTKGIDPLKAMSMAKYDKEGVNVYEKYLATKLYSMHFCGMAALNLTFEEGMRHLLLTFPAVMAFAATLAASDKRDVVCADDISSALMIVDHTFSRSPLFRLRHIRKMTRKLCGRNVFPSLLKNILPS